MRVLGRDVLAIVVTAPPRGPSLATVVAWARIRSPGSHLPIGPASGVIAGAEVSDRWENVGRHGRAHCRGRGPISAAELGVTLGTGTLVRENTAGRRPAYERILVESSHGWLVGA